MLRWNLNFINAFGIYCYSGNKANTIRFTTRSGILQASQEFPYITLDMPLNSPRSYEASNLEDMVKATTGELKLRDIKFCHTTRQLLICLADDYDLYIFIVQSTQRRLINLDK